MRAERHYQTEFPPEMLEPEPRARVEEFLTSRDFMKYAPGSVYVSPEGREYKVSAVDFVNRGFMLEDKPAREFKFFAGAELKGFKRRLAESDYAGEIYWHLDEGWAGKVLFCVPEKNILKIEKQDREIVDVRFDEFVEKFQELPDDLYAPFKDSYLADPNARRAIYVEDIDFENHKLVIQKCQVKIGLGGRSAWWNNLPDSSCKIPMSEFKKRFKRYVLSAQEIWGDLPDYAAEE
ncbi:hypothetical protein KJ969_04320 [Patescibacteria group bacterium]|nr:hypothetical protein [Patescibacteria group bacterium]MBU1922514.1 hypothetical protein [Patescibacteria group bacterium]